jgi:hypothetical protein
MPTLFHAVQSRIIHCPESHYVIDRSAEWRCSFRTSEIISSTSDAVPAGPYRIMAAVMSDTSSQSGITSGQDPKAQTFAERGRFGPAFKYVDVRPFERGKELKWNQRTLF